MEKEYIFIEEGKEVTEKEIRKWDFDVNVQDLINNEADIKEGIINVESVCECIVNSLKADIKTVIEDLNKCWGYDIKIYKKEN